MQDRNSFKNDAHFIFQQAWKCWWCGKNKADALHHIVGRGEMDSKVESSLLNAAPLCNHGCHLPHHGELKNEENIKMLLKKTYTFLLKTSYIFTELDAQFIEKYIKYYE